MWTNDIGTLRTISYNTDVALHIVCDIVKKRTMSYAMSYVKMARTDIKRTISYVFWRYRTSYIRCRTKHVRHRIRHRASKWQEPVFWLTTSYVKHTISYTISYTNIHMNRCCLVRIVTHHCPYRLFSTPVPQDHNDQDRAWNSNDERDYADQQSAPHSPTAHYPRSWDPLARFLSTGVSWTKWLWTTRSEDCQYQSQALLLLEYRCTTQSRCNSMIV